ncbi:phospholipase A2, minor isoenzyme-like [Callorhinchus milii]|uniref:phospholipase A2, minor isoenzyme-like n=1 Tax=Callorhinchus milii TaxID=7868 RepID=UPI0004572207|nr:phospholipase A2, minor isoenzyme-like [Callorhinchus milii]|eukprot:gi/632980238/ref/XP_007906920.1/ PREDICTED: phospholipase A2, minor isoenzyme-like [Callorhinchus milii]
MNCLVLALLFAGALGENFGPNAVWQFRNMIRCALPTSRPLLDYSDYGCYCGFGGYGTPVDDLDRCCHVHDYCYEEVGDIDECWPIRDNPYTTIYSYSCSGKKIICSSDNDPCAEAICECDRQAALCFAKSPYNEDYKRLDTEKFCN